MSGLRRPAAGLRPAAARRGPAPAGTVTQGTCSSVQRVLKAGSPVQPSPSGASPLPSNYTLAQKIVTYAVIYTPQFLVAFFIGVVLALLYGLIVGDLKTAPRGRMWARALIVALFPAGFILYVAWWAARHGA